MRLLFTTVLLIGAAALLAGGSQANAQYGGNGAGVSQGLLGTPRTCEHVISLMLRYGDGSSVASHSSGLLQVTPHGPAVIPSTELGDLELKSVTMLSEQDGDCGPLFAITIVNNSQRDVCNFHVSVVAAFGRIHPLSPTTVQRIDKLCAGQATEISMHLPIEALAMGRANGQALCFRSLVVAIDSYDQLLESNEANNLQVLAFADIPRPAVGVTAAEPVSPGGAPAASTLAEPPVTESGPPQGASPLQGNGAVTDEGAQTAPPANLPASPVDGLDFDNLDLGEATAAAFRTGS